jgi:hypothetical protein
MKLRRALVLFLICALARASSAQPAALPGLEDLPEPTRYLAGYVAAGGGLAMPFAGHWGDSGAGFKPSAAFSLSASKRVDEVLSYGLETSYSFKHQNRTVSDLELKLFSFTPFLRVSFPQENSVYYGILGAGLYQWSQPAYAAGGVRRASDSGSSAGVNLGGGVSYPFWWGTRIGLDLRWHHVFNMKGNNFDLNAADNMNIMLALHYGVWKNRAAGQ